MRRALRDAYGNCLTVSFPRGTIQHCCAGSPLVYGACSVLFAGPSLFVAHGVRSISVAAGGARLAALVICGMVQIGLSFAEPHERFIVRGCVGRTSAGGVRCAYGLS